MKTETGWKNPRMADAAAPVYSDAARDAVAPVVLEEHHAVVADVAALVVFVAVHAVVVAALDAVDTVRAALFLQLLVAHGEVETSGQEQEEVKKLRP